MRDWPHRSRPAVLSSLLAHCLALLHVLVVTQQAAAFPTHPGKWTGPMTWPGTAVNLILLAGGTTGDSTRVLWWQEDNADLIGGVWNWTPPNDAAVNGGTFPASNFVSQPLDDVPDNPTNIFCSGQTALPNGRLLVTGGSTLIEVGTKSALIFDPRATAGHNAQWTRVDSMKFRRWYSNNTLLPSGKVVTATGSSANYWITVGGLAEAATDTTSRMLQRIVVAPGQAWEASAVPTKRNSPNVGQVLAPFSDAAVTGICCSNMFAFGGKDKDGFLTRWDPLESTCRHASLSIL